MFENIIGQAEIVRTLREEISERRFPRSAFFFGPPYCGKLSAALETARVLTCETGTGDWSCECGACGSQRELSHPHTVLLGPRYSEVEIAACADALRRDPRPATRFLFLRSVRKLTRRYDSVLWESDDARARTAQEKAAKIEEMLFDLPPDEEEASERERAEFLEGVVAACTQLAALWRGDGISIGQIRRLSAWAHVTAASSRKIAILENADRMQEAARNALLKLLEEPPAQVHLLVLSPRREAIIPTIRSRMRPYPFAQRSAEEEREVLAKIFRAEPERYRTLRAFFLAWKEINPEALSTFASRFMERVAEAGPSVDIAREIEEVLPGGRNQKETAASLLEELTLRFRSLLRENAVPLDTLEEWSRAMRESQQKLELYNIHPASVVEALFHRMRLSGPRYGAAAAGSGSR